MIIIARSRETDGDPTRLGITVSRKVGNAVVRNGIKRRVREAFRHVRHDMPAGLDLVAIPRRRALRATIDELEADLLTGSKVLAPRLLSSRGAS